MKRILATLIVFLGVLAAQPAFAALSVQFKELVAPAAGTSVTITVQLVGEDPFLSGKVLIACTAPDGKVVRGTGIASTEGNKTFIVSCTGLKPSTKYTYVISADTKAFPPYSGDFTTSAGVSTPTVAESYAIKHQVEVGDVQSGYYPARVRVDVENPIYLRDYRSRLGKISGTSCIFDPAYVSVSRASENNYMIIDHTWKVPAGTYCIGVERQNASPSNEYSTVAGNLGQFSVGPNAQPGTYITGANQYGCEAADNTEYCSISLIPGVGDTTGKIDFDATECVLGSDTLTGEEGGGFSCYVNNLLRIVIGIVTVLSFVMVAVGGIEYMTGSSSSEKGSAKSRIRGAIIGLIIALGSYLILYTINPNLVNLKISIPDAQIALENTVEPTAGGGTFTGGGGNPNVKTNIATYDMLLAAAAQKYDLNCTFLKAEMYAESGGNPNATSSVGAKGLMQLMPKTFAGMGYDLSQIFDPATNIDASANYFSRLKKTACNGSQSNPVCRVSEEKFIIASYNGGPKANSVSKTCPGQTYWECSQNPGYAETRAYVKKVQGNYQILINGMGCGAPA